MMNKPQENVMDDPKFTESLALLRQAIDTVNGLTPKEYPKIPAIEFLAIKMMWQSVSRCDAIHLLLMDGLLDDATILLRSLMWDAQRLIYMDQNPDDRVALLMGLGNKQIHNMEALAKIVEELGLDSKTMREEVIRRRQQFEKARSARGIGKLKKFPAEGLGIARNIGRLSDMLGHQMYSASTHSAALSMFTNVSETADGEVTFSSRNRAPGYVGGTASSACEYLFEGAIATAKALGWDTKKELREQYAETTGKYERLFRQKTDSE